MSDDKKDKVAVEATPVAPDIPIDLPDHCVDTFPPSYFRNLGKERGYKGKELTNYVNNEFAKQDVSAVQRNATADVLSAVIRHSDYIPHIELTQRGDVRCKCDVTHPWNRRKRTQGEIFEALAIALDD